MSQRTRTGPEEQHKQQPNLQPSLAEIDEVREGREATSVSHLVAQGKDNGDRQGDKQGKLVSKRARDELKQVILTERSRWGFTVLTPHLIYIQRTISTTI